MLTGAIVGFGEVARFGHWPAWAVHPDVRIVAVVDRTAERRVLAQHLSPSIAVFPTLAEMAGAMSVDFVDICTPPALHLEPMLAAIARGWHVLCEKPFLLDPAAFEIVRERADAAGVAVVPVQNWKHAPIVARATEMLRGGAIGALERVELATTRCRPAPAADGPGVNWRRDPAIAGGGILMDHGWHAVYLALHWFGQRAVAVHGSLGRRALGCVEEEASLTIVFPAGAATVRLTWNGAARGNRIRLTGSRGELVIDDDLLRVPGGNPGAFQFARALSEGSHHPDWFAAMLGDVVACFRDPRRAWPLFDEAAECLAIILRAYQSELAQVTVDG